MKQPLRLGIVGLGMMGRHHARIVAQMHDVELVGGVDPAGDRHHAVIGRPVYTELEELLEEGIDAAVVAVPSEEHEKVALRLAEAGVHALIEKPISDTRESAEIIQKTFEEHDLIGAVGHVERFNPAVQEMMRRLERHELGNIISISTRRAGPHPARVRDLGVVKDLATHDIDLLLRLGGEVESISSHIAYRLGSDREDLLEAIGKLQNGTVFSLSVNWLTPSKERRLTVLGERGVFVADLISADLTFFANADVPMEWEALAQLKGVSEGDMIRYALRKPEPLQVQLEHFVGALSGEPSSQLATLADGVNVMRIAEEVLEDGGA